MKRHGCTIEAKQQVSMPHSKRVKQPHGGGAIVAEKMWRIVPSELANLTTNPIRKIVENIQQPSSNHNKEMIPLSLGTLPIRTLISWLQIWVVLSFMFRP